ncbi:MAG: hypothetical protein LBS11_07645 [Oscillospiraceae bacterium]|jgi:hypothetical protein|nr:hypothetical protein [Oscillospiraceae bacterium]
MDRMGNSRHIRTQALALAAILAALCLLAGAVPLAHARSHDSAKPHNGIDPCDFCLAALNAHALLKLLCLAMFAAELTRLLSLPPKPAGFTARARQSVTLFSLKTRLNP